jgi:hypothetical protein
MKSSVLVILALLAWSHSIIAVEYRDDVRDYTVVAGDTMETITKRMLGSSEFWQANWKLNPTVKNPNLLSIGQKLRVISTREVIAERAKIELATNQTEKQLAAASWRPAAAGDELADGDAVRTRAQSTAILRFNAQSILRLGEYSQIFLTKKETTLRGVDRASIEVSQGDVDVVFDKRGVSKTEIEVISGGSRVQAVADAQGNGQVRTGRGEGGATKVMVFAGNSTVSAAGANVNVPTGMGTKVPVKGPPMTPEKLLPAPTLNNAALQWNYSNGLVAWSAVKGAMNYAIEICADAACDHLQQRQRDVASAQWQVKPLPVGDWYWRVSAVSANGLDGYPSATGKLHISDANADLSAPALTLIPTQGWIENAAGAWIAGPKALANIAAFDEQSGMQKLESRYGDEAFAPLINSANVALHGGRFELRATDALGQAQVVVYNIVQQAQVSSK